MAELHNIDDFGKYIPDPKKPIVVIFNSMNFQAGLQSFFITMKSLLDVYAKLISKSIDHNSKLRGFGKKKTNGYEKPGGLLINWITNNAPATYKNKEKLLKILNNHIDEWICDVVKFRDGIIHHGELKGLTEIQVAVIKSPLEITKDEISKPTIMDKGDVLEYCQNIVTAINRLLKETLVLLPNLNIKLLSL